MFTSQLGQNIEAYIDDILVKTKTSLDIVQDLGETFETTHFRIKTKSREMNFQRICQKVFRFHDLPARNGDQPIKNCSYSKS